VAPDGVSMRRLLIGRITKIVYGQFASGGEGSEQPTPVEGAQKCDEPEDTAHDREARLHEIAPLIGRLPLGEKRAIIKLKARGLLGDVDVNRCARE
jgi:hypothetical protein